MSPLKRILLVITLIAVAALIGFGLYWAYKKTAIQPITGGIGGTTTTGELPSAGERPVGEIGVGIRTSTAGLPSAGSVPLTSANGSYYRPESVTKVNSDYALYPNLNESNSSLRYYNAADGKFYNIQNGTTQALSDQTFYNASKITWAENRDVAVIEYPDSSKIVYNFSTEKQVSLPKHWEEFSFSPDGKQIAAKSMGLARENRWLVTVNDDGTGTKMIEPMGENADRVTVGWSPSGQTVALSRTGEAVGADRQEVLFIGLNGENFKSTIVEGLGFEPAWSTTGKKLLYSVYSARSDYKPELWIVDAYGDNIGGNRQTLQLNTWADKCSFGSDDLLFCAVPKDLPTGSGMVPEIASSNFDELYKIDLKTGLKTNISLEGDYKIENITYDKSKNKVMFTDANQTGIFEAKL